MNHHTENLFKNTDNSHRVTDVSELAESFRKFRELRRKYITFFNDFQIAVRRSLKAAQEQCSFAEEAIAGLTGKTLDSLEVTRKAHQCSQDMNSQFKHFRSVLLEAASSYDTTAAENGRSLDATADSDARTEQEMLNVVPAVIDFPELIQYTTHFVDWWSNVDTDLANVETTVSEGNFHLLTDFTKQIWFDVMNKCKSFCEQISNAVLPTDQLQPTIFKELLSLLSQKLSTKEPTLAILEYSDSLRGFAEQLNDMYYVECLARSDHYRKELMELLRILRCSDEEGTRKALQKDEAYIVQILQNVLSSEVDKKAVLELPVTALEIFMNLTFNVMDKKVFPANDEGSRHRQNAHEFLVKLCKKCNILPPSLWITGIRDRTGHPVACGGFADIFCASYKGKVVALKRLRAFRIPQQDDTSQQPELIHKKFFKEAVVWQGIEHKNILPFYGVDMETFCPRLCMVSLWMSNETITKHFQKLGLLNVNVIRYFLEIAEGLQFLHSKNVVHGDLRGANIFIDQEWHVRLADFGLAGFAEVTLSVTPTAGSGAIRWMAPELLHPEKFADSETFRRTKASDIYSFACVGLEIHTLKHPFPEVPSDVLISQMVIDGERPTRPQGAMSNDLWDLTERCWHQESSQRPNTDDVLDRVKAISMVEGA